MARKNIQCRERTELEIGQCILATGTVYTVEGMTKLIVTCELSCNADALVVAQQMRRGVTTDAITRSQQDSLQHRYTGTLAVGARDMDRDVAPPGMAQRPAPGLDALQRNRAKVRKVYLITGEEDQRTGYEWQHERLSRIVPWVGNAVQYTYNADGSRKNVSYPAIYPTCIAVGATDADTMQVHASNPSNVVSVVQALAERVGLGEEDPAENWLARRAHCVHDHWNDSHRHA